MAFFQKRIVKGLIPVNKICKTYISEVKAFFPILGKDERSYISKLRTNVDDFCDEANISTKEELYKQYGMPIDVVHEYYSSVDTEIIIKRIKLATSIRRAIVTVVIFSLISMSYLCLTLHNSNKQFTKQEIVISEDIIK